MKGKDLDENGIDLLKTEIAGLRKSDLRTAFGFMLDLLISGKKPGFDNVQQLFPEVWKRVDDELRKTAGLKFHSLELAPDEDPKGARSRILEFLVQVDGIGYIPDAARALIFKKAAKKLAEAKDTSYGWVDEAKAAKGLAQFGVHVPSVAFDEVYQEILAVWCGNYWGRSTAYAVLNDFVFGLDTRGMMRIVELFRTNERVRSELFQGKPHTRAVQLLEAVKEKLTLEVHRNEVDVAIAALQQA